MKVFITGGSGLIGSALARHLAVSGHEPVILTRSVERAQQKLGDGFTYIEGDPTAAGDWRKAVSGCGAVVNLAGESIFMKRWSPKQKAVLRDSRVKATENCVRAIAEADEKPGVLVNGSAVGYYGFRDDTELSEDAVPGDDFLAKLCADWEAAADAAADHGARVIKLRSGIVLSAAGGALAQMLTPFKLCVGGPVLPGTQYLSWVHVGELAGILEHLITSQVEGPVNAVAPCPVTNREFAKTLGEVLRRPAIFSVPGFALRLRFGGVAEILTTGQRVVPTRLEQAGYRFKYPDLEAALTAILEK